MGERIKAGSHRLMRESPYVWEVEQQGDMQVPGRIYGDRETVNALVDDVRKGKDWNPRQERDGGSKHRTPDGPQAGPHEAGTGNASQRSQG